MDGHPETNSNFCSTPTSVPWTFETLLKIKIGSKQIYRAYSLGDRTPALFSDSGLTSKYAKSIDYGSSSVIEFNIGLQTSFAPKEFWPRKNVRLDHNHISLRRACMIALDNIVNIAWTDTISMASHIASLRKLNHVKEFCLDDWWAGRGYVIICHPLLPHTIQRYLWPNRLVFELNPYLLYRCWQQSLSVASQSRTWTAVMRLGEDDQGAEWVLKMGEDSQNRIHSRETVWPKLPTNYLRFQSLFEMYCIWFS